MDAEANKHSQHIVILPNPGASHLIPIVELTRRLLLLDPSLSFTFLLIPSSSSSSTPSVISSLPAASYDVITLPPPFFNPFSDTLDENVKVCLRSINHSLPVLRQTLREMMSRRRVSTLVVDIFATDAVEVAAELGIKSYICFTPSGIALSLFLGLPEVDETMSSGEWDLDMPLEFPGCVTVRVRHVPEPILDRESVYFKWFLEHSKRYKCVEGIILNSFDPLESGPIRALVNLNPPVYPVGPIVRTGSERNGYDSSGCLRWLDKQPQESVLYVSFGSGGTLSTDQLTELAWGLELSEQRFLWVVRSPNDSVAYGAYLSSDEKEDPLGFLPKGFIERTKERGLVVQSWAPQVEILGHGSTGGFMTHCGWNSVLEGVIHGVGFIAWPLYAEQNMNAVELVEEVKVALRVEKGDDGIARRDEIGRVAKRLMVGEEGREIKERMKTLKEEAKRAVNKDGSSNIALSQLLLKWKT
ncbi:hypothetical protein V2J09_008474 [Rumex salicifolius]